jgi:hypothetical protein
MFFINLVKDPPTTDILPGVDQILHFFQLTEHIFLNFWIT